MLRQCPHEKPPLYRTLSVSCMLYSVPAATTTLILNVLMKNHPCIEQCLFHVCCIQFLQQPTHVHWDSILVKNHPCIEHFLFHVHCIHHYGGGGGVGVGDFYALGHQCIFFLTRCCMASMGLFHATHYGRNRSFSCECFMVLKVFFSQDALWSQWVLSSHAMLYGLNRSFLKRHCMVSEGLFVLFLAVSAGLFLTGYFWTPKKLTIIVTQLAYYWWNANRILPNCFFLLWDFKSLSHLGVVVFFRLKKEEVLLCHLKDLMPRPPPWDQGKKGCHPNRNSSLQTVNLESHF